MRVYAINKIISILLPILVIGVVVGVVDAPQNWTMLLVGVSLLGYTHYILGAYYQHKAWRQRSNYRRFLGCFFVLSGLSVGCVVVALTYEILWLVALLTIPYFVWHGYENEHTLYTRTTGQRHSSLLLVGMSLLAVGATLDAFRHTSANFTYSLTYAHGLIPKFTGVLAYFNPYVYGVGSGLMIAGSIMVILVTLRRRSATTIFWSLVSVVLLGWFYIANPLPYIWLFVFLLTYHFLTWGIHYGVVFWPQSQKFMSYLWAHGLVVVGVVIVSIGMSSVTDQFPLGLLNSEFFLGATLVHISTSFLNDPWLQKILRL